LSRLFGIEPGLKAKELIMDLRRIIFPPGNDRHTRDKQTFSRRIFLKVTGIICLGFVPFLQACENISLGRDKMEHIEKTGIIAIKMKPPIDLAAPPVTETATFAMG
jgi:hypothetical protein